jgi:molecular chaperone DnaK (HSP70)
MLLSEFQARVSAHTSPTDRQIPTVLSYKESEELHGTQAKSQLVRNAENTVAYFRDFLGKK